MWYIRLTLAWTMLVGVFSAYCMRIYGPENEFMSG